LVWVDRQGNIEPLRSPLRQYDNPVISPDGGTAAVVISGPTRAIWLYDFSRGTLTPLPTPEGSSQAPIWTPDGKRITYRGTRTGFRNLFWKAVDGTSPEERLTTKEDASQTPGSWSPDGWLAFTDPDPATGGDISILRAGANAKPQRFLASTFEEASPRFSPDGRWMAYVSDKSGQAEIYVRPFPGPGQESLISTEGGIEPVWAPSGRELFYIDGDKMMAVDIATTPALVAGSPHVLFEGAYEPTLTGPVGFDVSRDGQRFLRVQTVGAQPPTDRIHVVLNWFEELKRLVPTN
jgi:Tol biopolymer transport system component